MLNLVWRTAPGATPGSSGRMAGMSTTPCLWMGGTAMRLLIYIKYYSGMLGYSIMGENNNKLFGLQTQILMGNAYRGPKQN